MPSPNRINSDKPHLWKADIAASVDQFNEWFMQFAPKAFRATRVTTTQHVKAALIATRDLRNIDPPTLSANPGALPTLRMCTAPPLAVDRLVGLASAKKSFIGGMEEGKLAARMKTELIDENLNKICRILAKLLDHDIFPWLESGKDPSPEERDRASTIVADRLCSATFRGQLRAERREYDLSFVAAYLDSVGYDRVAVAQGGERKPGKPGTYMTNIVVPLAMGRNVSLRVDVLIHPHAGATRVPWIVNIGSPQDVREAKKWASACTKSRRLIEMTYGESVRNFGVIGGYLDAGMLGSLAAGSFDWVWQHSVEQFDELLSGDPSQNLTLQLG